MVGSRVKISASACNIGIRDANCWFDSSMLVRKFNGLDLSNPFERAVCMLILFLVASHQTYIIGLSEYYDPETKTTIDLGIYSIAITCMTCTRMNLICQIKSKCWRLVLSLRFVLLLQ
jgi:hypothetical protein